MNSPTVTASFDPERALGASPQCRVFGVDEVGRGPLAGPVVAAAVHIPLPLWEEPEVRNLQDSKRVRAAERARLSTWIKAHCLWALAEVGPAEIDRLNILQASLLAMARALAQVPADQALIDGNKLPPTPVPAKALVKGDAKSRSIAAASILAKEHRDQIMRRLDAEFPVYGWSQNAGYPTAQHRAALTIHGPSCYHRATFRGVKNVTGSS